MNIRKCIYRVSLIFLGMIFLSISYAETCPKIEGQIFKNVSFNPNYFNKYQILCVYQCANTPCYPLTLDFYNYKPASGDWQSYPSGEKVCRTSIELCVFETI